MRVVEILGPSGVGKTYLYNSLLGMHTQRNYLSVSEACIKAALHFRPNINFSRQYLYYLLLKFGIFKSRKLGLANRILAGDAALPDPEAYYRVSINLLKRYLLTEEDAEVRAVRTKNLNRTIKLNLLLEKYLDGDDLVLFDEGILHHQHGLSDHLLETYGVEAIGRDRALNPYAVISCELSLEKNIERVKMRRSAGVRTFSHGHLSDSDLVRYISVNNTAYRMKIDWLKSSGIPVLVLNTETIQAQHVDAVHSFINKLAKYDKCKSF